VTREIFDSVLRSVVASMPDGSVIVDVSIDQGDCI
jgi:alanine dehydrogenase